jgi:hypothetical protein
MIEPSRLLVVQLSNIPNFLQGKYSTSQLKNCSPDLGDRLNNVKNGLSNRLATVEQSLIAMEEQIGQVHDLLTGISVKMK